MLSSGTPGRTNDQPAVTAPPKAVRNTVELKIINLAKSIKTLVTPQGESKQNETGKSGVDEKVNNCFKQIIELAKSSGALDGSVLNEVLMACNALRINNPELAMKVQYVSQTAKKLVEERTAGSEDASAPTSPLNSAKLGQLGIRGSSLAAPSTFVTQIPRESNADRSKEKLQKLTSDGLPPLKDFKKEKGDYADGSQHSVDFGFFDLSVHDRTGLPAWTGITPPPILDNPSPKMPKKMKYSVSQLNIADHQ